MDKAEEIPFMNHTINNTLKEKLLVQRSSDFSKNEFQQLYSRIFTDYDNSIAFLEAQDTAKQFSYAKRIINSLCFNSNFPPSLKLVNVLATFEKNIRNKRTVKHPSRDHYIHQCHLYFLGIYLFFNNKTFNKDLISYFSQTRYSKGISEESDAVKVFISCWKYFVLYHDLGYPLEYFGNQNHTFSQEETDFLEKRVNECFNNNSIVTNLHDMLSVKALSIIIAVSYSFSTDHCNSKKILKFINRKRNLLSIETNNPMDKEVLFNEDDVVKYISAVEDCSQIKYYLSIFAKSDFLVVVEKDHRIMCIARCGSSPCVLVDANFVRRKLCREIKKNVDILFSDELHLQYKEYQFSYYGINLEEKFDGILRNIGITNDGLLDLSKNLENVKKSLPIDRISLVYYNSLLDILKSDIIDSMTENNIKPEDEKPLSTYVKDSVMKLINVEIQSIVEPLGQTIPDRSSFINETSSMIRIILHALKGRLNTDQRYSIKNKDIALELAVDTLKQIPYIVNDDSLNNAKFFTRHLLDKMGFSTPDIDSILPLSRYSKDESSALEYDLVKNKRDILYENFSYLNSSPDIAAICKNYNLEFSNCDHGIVAFWLFLKHLDIYQQILREASCRTPLVYTSFIIPLCKTDEEQIHYIDEKYLLDYEQEISDVSFAIFVHNLYPKNFSHASGISFTTKRDATPFAYFSMLCDALQDWGRPFNIDPLNDTFPLSIDTAQYEISANNNDGKIALTFYEDDPKKIDTYIEKFAFQLDQYLEGASEIFTTSYKPAR
jgi:hypothetical protein